MSQAFEQSSPYMPTGDAAFREWLENLSTRVSADPNRYSLTQSDADVIRGHWEALSAIYPLAKQPETATKTLKTQKDAIKASAMASCRVYAMLVKNAPGVSDADKQALGLHLDDNTRSDIPAPSTAPLLAITGAFSGEHILRYADETTPTSRRKPAGAKLIEIYCNISANPDPVVANAKPMGLFGKQPITIEQSQENAGLTAVYFGRWVTAKGLVGPWGLPVGMTIAFGGPVDQAPGIMPTGGTPGTLEGEGGLHIAA